MTLRIGSLFSGAGMLDWGVETVLDARTIWVCENDKDASKVLDRRFTVTNLGDITKVDWKWVDAVDVLTGGFPCQDVSSAGLKAGLGRATRTGLWTYYADAIDALKPKLVVIENVRGLLSAEATRDLGSDAATLGDGPERAVLRAAGAVLGDLADLGYDAVWRTISASRFGAPHRRRRVFILAHPTDYQVDLPLRDDDGPGGPGQVRVDALLPTPAQWDGDRGPDFARRGREDSGGDDLVTTMVRLFPTRMQMTDLVWREYEPAIRRWEALTRVAPHPVIAPEKHAKRPRLSAEFDEWMMGWPAGWTDVGLSRQARLRICGNGVVPQQAAGALRMLLADMQ